MAKSAKLFDVILYKGAINPLRIIFSGILRFDVTRKEAQRIVDFLRGCVSTTSVGIKPITTTIRFDSAQGPGVINWTEPNLFSFWGADNGLESILIEKAGIDLSDLISDSILRLEDDDLDVEQGSVEDRVKKRIDDNLKGVFG